MQTQKKSTGIKKSGCLILLMLAANLAMAQPRSFMANVSADSAMKFRVWFANPEKAKVTISIQSETGNYSFSKSVSDAWYAQTYDFTGVEDGIYIVEMDRGKERFRKKIQIATDTYTMRTTKVY